MCKKKKQKQVTEYQLNIAQKADKTNISVV